VPFRPVVGPEDFHEVGWAVPRHLGDHPVAVLGSVAPAPVELANTRAAAGGLEAPAAARQVRAAEESSDGVGVPVGTGSGGVSYDGSSAGASFACGSRSSCASASCPNPSWLLSLARRTDHSGGRGGGSLEHLGLQLLARLEYRHQLGRNLDLGPAA